MLYTSIVALVLFMQAIVRSYGRSSFEIFTSTSTLSSPTEFPKWIGFLFVAPCWPASPASATSTITNRRFTERNEPGALVIAGALIVIDLCCRCGAWHEVFGYVLHVRLYSCRMKRFVVSEVF